MKLVKGFGVALCLCALAGCSKESSPQTKNATSVDKAALTQTATSSAPAVDAKEMIAVGIDGSYPPYDFLDELGQPAGFDVEILKAIGDKQGLKFAFIPENWDNLKLSLDSKKVAVAIAGFARTDEREAEYQVSNTYAYGQDVIAMLNGTTGVKTYEDLKNKQVITLGDSPYIAQLEELMGKGNPKLIGESNSFLVVKGLINKKADVAFIDKGVIQHYAQQFPNAQLQMVDKGSPEFEAYELVILANKQEAELMKKINAGLSQIVQDGTYTAIYKKWFGVEPSQLPK